MVLPQEELSAHIGNNIAYYRKKCGLTQGELATLINYSDKSVSKWERPAGMPDIYILTVLADLFKVTVSDLISDNPEANASKDKLEEPRRIVTCFQLIVAVWFLATIAFAVWKIFFADFAYANMAWIVFVIAVPASNIVYIVFSVKYWGAVSRIISVSVEAWTAAACVYLFLLSYPYAWLYFVVCAVAQVLVGLWFIRQWLNDKVRKYKE